MGEGKAKPRISLLANDIFVKAPCVMCGKTFKTGEILPELYEEDGLAGYVCDDCAYEPQNYAAKLRAQAEDLENETQGLVAWLRSLADSGIEPPDADYRLELESLIAVGDSKETEKLNAAEQEKDLPAENLKGKKFLGLTWDEDGEKLVLRFEGDRILWIAPARKGEEGEELVVDTDAALILGEGPSGDELINHTKGYFGPAPGTTLHKWS